MRHPARLVYLLTLPLLALGAAATTHAQEIADAKANNDWFAAIVAVLMVVVLAMGSFIGSRRGHQD